MQLQVLGTSWLIITIIYKRTKYQHETKQRWGFIRYFYFIPTFHRKWFDKILFKLKEKMFISIVLFWPATQVNSLCWGADLIVEHLRQYHVSLCFAWYGFIFFSVSFIYQYHINKLFWCILWLHFLSFYIHQFFAFLISQYITFCWKQYPSISVRVSPQDVRHD